MKYLHIFIVIVVCAATGWYLWNSGTSLLPQVSVNTASTTQATTQTVTPTGAREYRSDKYKFSFFYPEGYEVNEYFEVGGALTITVQSVSEAQGFQIYVTPYTGTEISPEQVRLDLPSGVIKEPKNIGLGGAIATSFNSIDPILGETREMWSIHGGYLYEITSLKVLDIWFAKVIETWKFL